MFYFTFIFLLVSVFLLAKDPKSIYPRYLILTIASYILAIYAMMFYLSKDTYYYNAVNNYFSMPTILWKYMMFSQIQRSSIIRIMNIASLSVLYFGLRFTMHLLSHKPKTTFRHIARGVLLLFILEFFTYDPAFTRFLYILLTDRFMTPSGFDILTSIAHTITAFCNLLVLLFSFYLLYSAYKKASPLRMIRLNIVTIGLCYVLMMISYIFFFLHYPIVLVKISKIADLVTYKTIPLSQNPIIYQYFPYYLIITLIIMGYALYKNGSIHRHIHQQTFSLSKQIAASDTTSKVFCHYMKNELLAIESELMNIQTSDATHPAIHNVMLRCENLYERLDHIHRSTKASELKLTEVNLLTTLKRSLDHLTYETKDVTIDFIHDHGPFYVMLDEEYFDQALHNIIMNALDSMDQLSSERKRLEFHIEHIENWVMLSIKDYGKGISKENLNKVLTPFYTSEPVSRHWGIGLTLTHKIITAHEGLLDISSTLGEGTTVRIMLPQLNPYSESPLKHT